MATITIANWLNLVSLEVSTAVTLVIFFADYVAEMYDPHADNPGDGFKAHFHRFLEDDGED